jgi:hypothetical protein
MAGSREHGSWVLGPTEFEERLLPSQDEFFVSQLNMATEQVINTSHRPTLHRLAAKRQQGKYL